MKSYKKAELDIVEFRKNADILMGASDPYDPFLDMNSSDEVFINEEEGYIK